MKRGGWLRVCFTLAVGLGWGSFAHGLGIRMWQVAFARKDFAKALEHYENGEFQEAFRFFKKSGKAGFGPAQIYLGIAYETGRGAGKNLKGAIEWYCRAADQNLPDAYFHLGRLCLMRGDARGTAEAFRLFRLAADLGHVEACFNVGLFYHNGGPEIEANRELALAYFKLAGEAGHHEAQTVLGGLYENGIGVEKDEAKALTWYLRAAAKGHAYAQCCVADLYLAAARFDPEQAARWYRRAADQGLAEAQHRLGRLYEQGVGVEKNREEALRWYEKAAKGGHREALEIMGGNPVDPR